MSNENTPQDECHRPAVGGPVERMVRPGAEARWYCVDRNGVAMLCANEADANWEVTDNTKLFPKCAPYIAVRLVGQQQPLTRQQIDDLMTEHYPLDSLLRENVDAFESCVRDLERRHGIGA